MPEVSERPLSPWWLAAGVLALSTAGYAVILVIASGLMRGSLAEQAQFVLLLVGGTYGLIALWWLLVHVGFRRGTALPRWALSGLVAGVIINLAVVAPTLPRWAPLFQFESLRELMRNLFALAFPLVMLAPLAICAHLLLLRRRRRLTT